MTQQIHQLTVAPEYLCINYVYWCMLTLLCLVHLSYCCFHCAQSKRSIPQTVGTYHGFWYLPRRADQLIPVTAYPQYQMSPENPSHYPAQQHNALFRRLSRQCL